MMPVIHRPHQCIADESDREQHRHQVHRAVVESRRRIARAGRHDFHQSRDRHGLCGHELVELLEPRAKALLDNKGVKYTEHDVTDKDDERAKLVEKSGGRKTVPQIFIADQLIGGYSDLAKLDQQGKLDAMLGI